MHLSKIYQPIQKELEQFEDSFIKQITRQNGFTPALINRLLSSQGKRLRPALVLFSAKINNKKITPPLLSLAVAMELIHTASLIHDDVVDGANLRRKTSTINANGDNQLAVLMGDYLYSQASAILSYINNQKILVNLSKTTTGMCRSEISQFNRRGDFSLKEGEYLKIIKDKTASLIASCCYNAAVLAGASAERIQALTDYGLNFGLGFQIIDDCLDFTGKEKRLGKTLGLDLKRGSLTLPLIYFLRNRRPVPDMTSDLNKLRNLILKSDALTQTYQKAKTYIQKAQSALKIFKNSAVKNSLVELSEFVLTRTA